MTYSFCKFEVWHIARWFALHLKNPPLVLLIWWLCGEVANAKIWKKRLYILQLLFNAWKSSNFVWSPSRITWWETSKRKRIA